MRFHMKRTILASLALGSIALPLRGEFLFSPPEVTDNGLFKPTLTFHQEPDQSDYGLWYEYSAWDVFYSPNSGEGNYPDIFAPDGGVWRDGQWHPEERPPGFPVSPGSNPQNPLAFWHPYNPTITQTAANSGAFIIAPDDRGNIYTFQAKTSYQLHNHPDYNDRESVYNGFGSLGTVIFQFQTEGTNVDFQNIVLKVAATDGNIYTFGVNDPETEYLREYATGTSDHWSASAGYSNRTLLQWDLSGIEGTGEFWIEWNSLSSSMSFQKADLITASYYEAGIPTSSTWNDSYSSGNWSDGTYWVSGSAPVENGNLKFTNGGAIAVAIDDASHTVGEILFDGAHNVTFTSDAGHRLIANTGVTVRPDSAPTAADRTYTFDVDYELGSLNFLEISQGSVVFNGSISGNYGIVKLGEGSVVFNNDNTFTKFLAVQGGDLYINGSNSYTGATTIVNGRVFISNDDALGSSTAPVVLGGDADLYAFTTGAAHWMAELYLVGDIELNRDIALAAGDLGKRLGAVGTDNGAVFSGNISFSGVPANPDFEGRTAVDRAFITAAEESDRLFFTGTMTGGAADAIVTLDGLGTVVYAGADKTYANSTVISSGTLLIEAGSGFTNGGSISVSAGAKLEVEGIVNGKGDLLINGGHVRVEGVVGGSGNVTVDGGRISGAGTVARTISLANGAILAPGNSVGVLTTGTQSWGGGGVYEWEISSIFGDEGIDWDLLAVEGDINIASTGVNPFEIRVVIAGDALNFDPEASYSWKIITATGSINDFDESLFTITANAFGSDVANAFRLQQQGGDLYLIYAIPEPSTYAAAALGAVFIGGQLLRQRRLRGRQS